MSDQDDTIGRLFGAFLMALGGLMALLCGGCSLYFMVVSKGVFLLGALLVGVAPAFIGVMVFRSGLRRYRRPPPYNSSR